MAEPLCCNYASGPLAQLVAHLHDTQGVRGSSPLRPTTLPYSNFGAATVPPVGRVPRPADEVLAGVLPYWKHMGHGE